MHQHRTLTALVLGTVAAAQSNTIPGLDAHLGDLGNPVQMARRSAAHPAGEIALSFDSVVCNTGAVPIAWSGPLAGPLPMAAAHPFEAAMVVRESGDRMVQISRDSTFVRHAANAGNAGSVCGGQCTPGNGVLLGVGCGDANTAATFADRFWLGPVDEVDPWLGAWNPVGSYFDRGDPEVAFPANADGVRSLTGTFADGVRNRIAVREADLLQPGRFFYALQLVVAGEDAELRTDNVTHRQMTPSWNGTDWTFTDAAGPSYGSVLQSWQGATVSAARNGEDDGHVWVGVKVTGPIGGLYHYEYAVHDVDNARGVASLRIPVCASTQLANLGSRDVDDDPLDDWTWSRNAQELVFQAPANNPLRWNRLFNFWFDCATAPVPGTVVCDQAAPGTGNLQLAINARIPGGSALVQNRGPGCGNPSPTIAADGWPVLGNRDFGLPIATTPGAALFVVYSARPASLPLGGGCVQYLDPGAVRTYGFLLADASGAARVPLPIPNNALFDGLPLHWQVAQLQPGGPVLGQLTLGNGLLMQVGCRHETPALVQYSGFETGDPSEFSDVVGGVGVQGTVVHGGQFALRCQAPVGGYAYVTMMGLDETGLNDQPLNLPDLYSSFWFRFAQATSRSRVAEIAGQQWAEKASLELEVDRRLSIQGFAQADRLFSASALQPDRWYRLRWYVGTGAVARTVLMIDDTLEIDATTDLSNETTSRFHIGRSSRAGDAVDFYFDDLVLASGGFPADGEVRMLVPSGLGTDRTWLGSFTDVDDRPNDGDATFVAANGAGDAATFALSSAAAAGISGRVLAVKTLALLRRESLQWSPTAVRLRALATVSDTLDNDGGPSYRSRGRIYPTHPATGLSWQLADLASMEVGAVNLTPEPVRMTACGLSVWFAR